MRLGLVGLFGIAFGSITFAGDPPAPPPLPEPPERAAALIAVDELERETARLDPRVARRFVEEGRLGRTEQDWDLPARLPPTPPPPPPGGARPAPATNDQGLGGLFGGLGEKLGTESGLGPSTGRRIGETAAAIAKSARAYAEAMSRKLTPEQERDWGRSVAVDLVAKHGIERDRRLRAYVRCVGDVLVRKSVRVPPNAGGYHFEVLDSDEIDTSSAPGGFVFVTRGAVRSCRDEDELAALLAHELAHVALKHAEHMNRMRASSRAALATFGDALIAASGGKAAEREKTERAMAAWAESAAAKRALAEREARLTRETDLEADREATWILADVVYDHGALVDVLRRRRSSSQDVADRVRALDEQLRGHGRAHPGVVEARSARAVRFRAATGPTIRR